MSRQVFLDRSAGEARAVVTLKGKPERLLIERDGDLACQRLGAVMTARVTRIERGLASAFLQLPEGRDAILPIRPDLGLAEGAAIEIAIATEARSEKGAVARLIGPSSGPPRLIAPGPNIEARLSELASGLEIQTGAPAREAADEAQEAAIAVLHPLPGGGSISMEPTRALVAIDVDLGARGGGDGPRALRQANLAAIDTGARLLRLKGLGGLVVFDLAGKGHDGAALSAAARAAFAPDGTGVAIGPISRFGLFELAIPRTAAPIAERLLDETGQPSALTVALSLARAIEREGRSNPGARLFARASPEVAAVAQTLQAALAERLGARFTIEPDARLVRVQYEVDAR